MVKVLLLSLVWLFVAGCPSEEGGVPARPSALPPAARSAVPSTRTFAPGPTSSAAATARAEASGADVLATFPAPFDMAETDDVVLDRPIQYRRGTDLLLPSAWQIQSRGEGGGDLFLNTKGDVGRLYVAYVFSRADPSWAAAVRECRDLVPTMTTVKLDLDRVGAQQVERLSSCRSITMASGTKAHSWTGRGKRVARQVDILYLVTLPLVDRDSMQLVASVATDADPSVSRGLVAGLRTLRVAPDRK